MRNRFAPCYWLVILWLALGSPARAASVLAVTTDQLVNGSALIFDGRVSRLEVVEQPGSRLLHTLVTFEILDRLKGPDPGPTLELRFLGGAKGDRSLVVSDLRLPSMGERGLYFVEQLDRPQVNPLLGWDQGRFLSGRDPASGAEQILTPSGRPVFAFDSSRGAATGLAKEGAQGVRLRARNSLERPLTLEELKQQVRGILSAGKQP